MFPILILPTLMLLDSWKSYDSKDHHFSASFPGDVKRQSADQEVSGMKITTEIYVAGGNGLACIVSVTKLPASFPSSERKNLVQGVKTGFGGQTGLSVVSEAPATFNGVKGTLVKFAKGAGHAAVWVVDRPADMFTMTVYAAKGDSAAAEKRFFGSIKMTK